MAVLSRYHQKCDFTQNLHFLSFYGMELMFISLFNFLFYLKLFEIELRERKGEFQFFFVKEKKKSTIDNCH